MRFVVSDMEEEKAIVLYQQIYYHRGAAELFIKEHKLYLKSDRTSCHRFQANQFRLFLHSSAYVLLRALRAHVLKHIQWAHATVEIIRLKHFKIGACVRELKTKIKVACQHRVLCKASDAKFSIFRKFGAFVAGKNIQIGCVLKNKNIR